MARRASDDSILTKLLSANTTRKQEPHFVSFPNGHVMPIIGLGMWQTDDEMSVGTALEAALAAGYRHFDTAFSYQNEHIIGRLLPGILKAANVERKDIFVVSKLPCNGMRPKEVEYFFNRTLNDLKLDYLDLYLIHLPVSTQRTENEFDYLPQQDGDLLADNVDLMDTWKAMESLVDRRLVRSIGLSNCNSVQVKRIYTESRIKPSVLQIECHAYLPQFELVEFCEKKNIKVTAYAPLGSPGLPGFAKKMFGADLDLDVLLEDHRLTPLCEKYDKTPAQILLRYLIERGVAVIPKSSNPRRIIENFQVFDFALDEDDMEVLKSMGRNYRYFLYNHLEGLRNHKEYPFNIPF